MQIHSRESEGGDRERANVDEGERRIMRVGPLAPPHGADHGYWATKIAK